MATGSDSEIALGDELIILEDNGIMVEISPTGEIVGIKNGQLQLLHGGGKDDSQKEGPDHIGWKRSEIIMFPVVGPVGNYKITVGDGCSEKERPMDQHGISRYIPFTVSRISKKSISLIQEYAAESPVRNGKHNDNEGKERPAIMAWPYSFSIEKDISIHHLKCHDDFGGYTGFVNIDFHVMNRSDSIMPFMLGFHPAFRTYGTEGSIIIEQGESAKDIALDGFLGKDITSFNKNTGDIFFRNSKYHMRIHHTFGNTMVWCPKGTTEMVCIEPVTSIPSTLENSGYRLNAPQFEFIFPDSTKIYNMRIFF